MKRVYFGLAFVAVLLIAGCGEKKEKSVEVKSQTQTPKVKEIKEEKVAKAPLVKAKEDNTKEKEADGAKLFAKCAGCHGAKAEKKALGKSQVIKGWSKDKILQTLKGYKDGTYGGAMKSLMQAQVKTLSDKEMEILSDHIAQF